MDWKKAAAALFIWRGANARNRNRRGRTRGRARYGRNYRRGGLLRRLFRY